MKLLSKIPPQTAFQVGIYFLVEKKSDLTTRQLGVLMKCADGMQTVRGMAAYFGVSKPAISRAIGKLAGFGLVRRALSFCVNCTKKWRIKMTKQTEKPPRKIVQIAAATESENSEATLFALCDDGELFVMPFGIDWGWRAVDPIPQEDTP